MEIYLIEKDYNKFKYLDLYFKTYTDEKVKTVNSDLKTFLMNNKVQCVVSPANSFGLMDGGYDLALTNWYGTQLQERVQDYIIKNFYGEQAVGTSFIIETNKDNQYLIHTPTMRTPEEIVDARIIYQCMRETLILAKKNNIESILIPMFGAHTGNVKPQIVAQMMLKAYQQVNNPPTKIDWNYVETVDMLPEEDFHMGEKYLYELLKCYRVMKSLNILNKALLEDNKTVLFFSLETFKGEVIPSISLSKSKIEKEKADCRQILLNIIKLINTKLYIDDTPSITIGEIINKCTKFKKEKNIELVIVDNIQLITTNKNIQDKVSYINNKLKKLEQELDISIITTSTTTDEE